MCAIIRFFIDHGFDVNKCDGCFGAQCLWALTLSTFDRYMIEATKLLLENTENTFVTPVYNGSASLRNAAGQLIENVTKSMNRKEIVDDAYMEKLFANVTSLYRIGEAGKGVSGKAELGALPGGSKALIIALAVIWVLIAVYFIVILKKKLTKHEK